MGFGESKISGDVAYLPQDPAGTAMWSDNWAHRAACHQVGDPDALFVQGAEQNRAKLVCGGCPVRAECLADALDNRAEFGVWGGMTERERRALLKRRPDVPSWRALLQGAKADHERRQIHQVSVPAQRSVR